MSGVFDYVNAISLTKKNFVREAHDPETEVLNYVPWIVNKAFSYHIDSCLYANAMNMYPFLSNLMQYDYLFHSLSKKKRFSKQFKPEKNEIVMVISEIYKCNRKVAEEYLDLLSETEIKELLKKVDIGG